MLTGLTVNGVEVILEEIHETKAYLVCELCLLSKYRKCTVSHIYVELLGLRSVVHLFNSMAYLHILGRKYISSLRDDKLSCETDIGNGMNSHITVENADGCLKHRSETKNILLGEIPLHTPIAKDKHQMNKFDFANSRAFPIIQYYIWCSRDKSQ